MDCVVCAVERVCIASLELCKVVVVCEVPVVDKAAKGTFCGIAAVWEFAVLCVVALVCIAPLVNFLEVVVDCVAPVVS